MQETDAREGEYYDVTRANCAASLPHLVCRESDRMAPGPNQVVAYCPVQCGLVVAALNIQINPPMVHQRNHHIQMVGACCYHQCCAPVIVTWEPGFAWLENMRSYGRMADLPNSVDHRVMGGNPCLEQSLESFEMCCLVETFPARLVSSRVFRASTLRGQDAQRQTPTTLNHPRYHTKAHD